ncbi:hypothetical protein KYK29_10325 [Shinella daejeonensis]|uniref:hypothetical protein n=1 Tax=Shinella daejeonensis TaxID=659017 RepID=UPI0020C7D0CA|nr:hypothetical protein [Shinella daejeonensis]MCP8895329.1 hypothetical protein [Shinella daejeonensis]
MKMVEKAARKIYERRNGHGCKPWSRLPRSHQEPYLTDASAAIEAMREPTEVMSEVGRDHNFNRYAEPAWQAMIDAALNEVAG